LDRSQRLEELVGKIADAFALRGNQSVQVAAARSLQEAGSEDVYFSSCDARLRKSAKVLGMIASVSPATG
jgi:uncharacterized protein